MASVSHLLISSSHHVGTIEFRNLKILHYSNDLVHNMCTKFHEISSSHSLTIKLGLTDITCKRENSVELHKVR
jgi:hypothetical protein